MDDALRQLYEEELFAIRQNSKEFAKHYPKIASRLLLEAEGSADPHVERMLQGFAFLTARLRKKLDDDYPELTEALLNILYPHLLRPIPSCSIAEMTIDQINTPLTNMYTIEPHTNLVTSPVDGVPCKFRTTYPVDLWPIIVKEARYIPVEQAGFTSRVRDCVAYIVISLECVAGRTFGTFDKFQKLRFYLGGDAPTANTLYELLFNSLADVYISEDFSKRQNIKTLPKGSVTPVGFKEEEGLIDYDKRSFLGYRLLQDYFTMPEKFLFFDVHNFDKIIHPEWNNRLDLVFAIKHFGHDERAKYLVRSVHADNFRLFCTPIVNLFKIRAEPISLNHLRTEYPVIPQQKWAKGTEVFSIDHVSKVSRKTQKEEITEVPPLFDFKDIDRDNPPKIFWTSRRSPSTDADDSGTDVTISVVDQNMTSQANTGDVLLLSTTCSNRDLPVSLPLENGMGQIQFEQNDPMAQVRCLRNPTRPLRPSLKRGAQWRLVSHLTLNHLSLVQDGKDALLEILNLYNFSDSLSVRQEISSITAVHSEPTVARVGPPHRQSFCRGMHIGLEIDEDHFVSGEAFLFSMILDYFFALYTSMNSFTQLTVRSKQRENDFVVWPARLGYNILI